MTKKELEDRVVELERRVKELEAQPRETHTHFHTYPPLYVQPYVSPLQPTPWEPYRITWSADAGTLSIGGGGNGTSTVTSRTDTPFTFTRSGN